MTSYVKTTWSDRIVQNPLTYTQQTNGDGTITLIPAEGTITQSGTPITATALNNMENGIANALDTTAGGTVNGIVTFAQTIVFPTLQGLKFQAGRTGETTIFWNANTTNTYGLVFKEDGKDCCAMFGGDTSGTIQGLHDDLYFRAGNPYVWADNGYFRVKFANGNWLNISEGQIQNPSGNGDIVIASGDGAGWCILRSPVGRVALESNDKVTCTNTGYSGYVPIWASAFTNGSARSLKDNIVDFDNDALEIINKAKIKSFKYKNDKVGQSARIGLIHDEAPAEVTDGLDEGVDLYKMVSVAWKAIQEMSEKITVLESKIAELEAK